MKNLNRLLRNLVLAATLGTATALTVPTHAEAQSMSSAAETANVVNLNTATEAELTTLPRVGPSRAQAIIRHRERRPFRRVEDLMRVRGIGRATFRRLRPMLRVN